MLRQPPKKRLTEWSFPGGGSAAVMSVNQGSDNPRDGEYHANHQNND